MPTGSPTSRSRPRRRCPGSPIPMATGRGTTRRTRTSTSSGTGPSSGRRRGREWPTATPTGSGMGSNSPDADGLPNLAEQLLGTHPADRRHGRRRHPGWRRGCRWRRALERRGAVHRHRPDRSRHRRRRHARRRGAAADGRVTTTVRCRRLPDPADHERLEHPDRRPPDRLELRDADLDHRDVEWPPHGLRVVRGLRDPVQRRRLRHPACQRRVHLARRVGRRPVSDPGERPARGRTAWRAATGTSFWSTRTLRPLRAVPGAQGHERPLEGRIGGDLDLRSNDLRPAGWTLRRCGRPADPAGPHPVRGGRRRRDRPRAPVHGPETRNTYIYPARHQAARPRAAPSTRRWDSVCASRPRRTRGFGPHARIVLTALKHYGMILADNGSPWYVTGVSDPRFDDDEMHELDRFHRLGLRGGRYDGAGQRTLTAMPHGHAWARITPSGRRTGERRREGVAVRVGLVVPQGWTGDYDGWSRPPRGSGRSRSPSWRSASGSSRPGSTTTSRRSRSHR